MTAALAILASLALIVGIPALFYALANRAIDRTAMRWEDPDTWGDQ